MAPSKNRWKDVTLDPCNASAQRRNTAAIRDALQGLAEQEAVTPVAVGGGSQLIFFEVQADAVGDPSVAVKEVLFNSVSGLWETTGAAYTAYDWTPSNRFRPNFEIGYYGIGRISTNVAADALEILALEGKARLIQVTLTENMGATTTKEAACSVTDYWGDAPNGRNPGATVTIHDVTNMAPALTLGSKALAVWDENRSAYIMIAPWKGVQAPGQAAIIQVSGGDVAVGCDDSVIADDAICLYRGHLLAISLAGDLCVEDFTSGAPIWVLDARSCHSNSRLGMNERYVAVGMGVTFDPDPGGPGTDERALYSIVDYAPALRWFRILPDSVTFGFANPENNHLRCRTHQCGGGQPADAPSQWGTWEDIDPCTRVLQVLDPTPRLIYFPKYRSLCKPAAQQTNEEKCLSGDRDPNCRKNAFILAFWNPLAERWDAITDSEQCASKQDIAKVVVCNGTMITECCLWDGIKVLFWPRGNSYCDPSRDVEKVWVKCNSSANVLPDSYCEIGPKICNAFECNGETRPVYLIQCGQCDCACPDMGVDQVRYTIRINNIDGPCGYLDGIAGILRCADQNPFEIPDPGAPMQGPGWYGHIVVTGLTARLLYQIDAPGGAIHWIEIACGGEPGTTPGQIIFEYDDDDVPVGLSSHYDTGINECRPKMQTNPDGSSTQLTRIRNYNYGIWAQCSPSSGAINSAALYLLAHDLQLAFINPDCSGGDSTKSVIANLDQVWSDRQLNDLSSTECCDNTSKLCFDKTFGCNSSLAEFPIQAAMADDGVKVCNACTNSGGGHIFGGCPCVWINQGCGAGNLPCTVGPFPIPQTDPVTGNGSNCCSHEENRLCIEFQWTVSELEL